MCFDGRSTTYALVVAHPFNLVPPLAVAELITNEHDIDSIRLLFHDLRCCERRIYKTSGNEAPLGIMTDFSLAIVCTALLENIGKSFLDYLERTFWIMSGKADMNDINQLLVFTCTVHVMTNVKKHAVANTGDPDALSEQHFAMLFGILILLIAAYFGLPL